jgi:uncharacterized membrane protein
MSGTTLFGIIVTVVLAISIVIVAVMFWWGAREDGRDQKRTDARVRGGPEEVSRDVPPRR